LLESAVLALLTAVIWGAGDFLSRKPSSEIGSMLTSVLIQPLGLFMIILVLFALDQQNGFHAAWQNPEFLAINLGAGVIAFFGILVLYTGYAEGIMSIVAPIGGAYPVVAVTLSIVLLGTTLTPVRSIAIILTIVGIVLAGVKLSSFTRSGDSLTDRHKIVRGADYGIAAFLLAGFGLFCLGVAAPVIGAILAVVVLKSSQTLTAGSMVLLRRVKLTRPRPTTLGWVALIGACDAVGFATYNLAIVSASSDLPIVVTLSSLLGVVTVLLARIFYKEKLEPIQLAGVVIIFASVAAILYF